MVTVSTKYIVYTDYDPDPYIKMFDSLNDAQTEYEKRLKEFANDGIPVYIAKIIK